MAAKAVIEIICGDFPGYFYPSRFGPAGKSLCVKLDKSESSAWMTPVEFEKKAGKGAQHNWKRTVRSVTHENKTFWKCIEEGVVNICPNVKDCKCRPCILSKGGTDAGKSPSKSPEAKVPAKKTPPPSKKVSSTSSTSAASSNTSKSISVAESSIKRDTDSDSGISIEISSNTTSSMTPIPPPIPMPILLEPLTTEEQVRSLPNYTLMVQEAIIALGKGEKSNENFQGCSLLGIFLYILRQYPNTQTQDSVIVMNIKIRSSLALLKRMGIVKSINDELDDLEIESTLPSSIEPEPDTDVTDKKELVEKVVKIKKESKLKPKSTPKSNAGTSLKTTSVAAASSEAAVKKKVSKNLVKKAKILSQGKMMKSSPNSSTSTVVKSAKKSSSAKVQKLKIKIGSKKGAGKENSNKQPFQFEKLKLKSLSPALALICGKPQMSRHEAVREIWAYIKKQKLQDPGQKTIIFCDEKLKAVTKKKKVTCSEILTCLSQNMTAIKN